MKNLLTENEIRKMMKYANINTLADGFVTRLNEEKHEEEPVEEAYMADDDEEMEEGMGMMADEPEMQDDDPMDEPPAVDEPEMDAAPAGDMDVEKLVSDLADVISRHTGVDVEVEDEVGGEDMGDDMPADDLAADAGDEPAPMDEMEHGGMADDDEPMEEGEYKADDDDEPMEESQEETLEEVVNMIARRVAKRILTEQ